MNSKKSQQPQQPQRPKREATTASIQRGKTYVSPYGSLGSYGSDQSSGCSGGGCSAQSQAQAQAQAEQNEILRKQKELQYTSEKTAAGYEAGNEARLKVTERRLKLIKDSGQLLTDFERQEKIRLLKAKKGKGQVSEDDLALTEEDRKKAKESLNLTEDYWKTERDKAFKDAQEKALKSFRPFKG